MAHAKPTVRGEYLPPDITIGELAAIADSTRSGWIVPPVYDCLRSARSRAWRTAHLRYLDRRGLIRERRRRIDGQFLYRLNADALRLHRAAGMMT